MTATSVRKLLSMAAAAGIVVAHSHARASALAAGQWNPNQQAVDRCEQDLNYRMGSEASAREPQTSLDYNNLDVRQQGRNSLTVAGRGSFRRDRTDRARQFTFDCTVDTRSGNARTNYRWGSSWNGDYNEPGYEQPPSYRPPYGGRSEGSSYPPSGRVFFSGGIINRASGKALDVENQNMHDGANIQQWDFAAAANQKWDVIDQGGGRFAIVRQGTGKALDVVNHSSADGANVQQFRFANGDNQLWRLERVGGGFYQIISLSSGKCLDVDQARIHDNGATVQQWGCGNNKPNQQWRLAP